MNKKLLLLPSFLVLFLSANAQFNSLIGTWESRDLDEPVEMILDENGFITFRVDDQLLGGRGYTNDGETLRMTYKTFEQDSTIKITIIIKDLKKNRILKRDTGIIRYIDSNNIEVCFKKTLQESNKLVTNDCRHFLKIR